MRSLCVFILCFFLQYFLLFPGDTSAQKIMPLTEEVQVSEGDNVTLSCTYSSSSSNDALQWYRQFPRSTPEFLLYIYPQGGMSDPLPPRMSAEAEENKHVNLSISSTAVSDSALYYCALRPTVTGNPATLYKNLPLQTEYELLHLQNKDLE
uniref:Ig-like domain-containing protein n=1 Tax=Pygocentrus nattereri TaxID=42514 RepID=A0A3B4DR01_PYGNA